MPSSSRHPVVHLELRTGNPPRARAFYTRLFGWQAETIRVGAAAYHTLGWDQPLEVGVVEVDTAHPLWLPYVEVADIHESTERATRLGATVTLEPREGPAGWRSIITGPAGGEMGLWRPKP
jgi:predicted enzyme related to lactoylglutathione lyase